MPHNAIRSFIMSKKKTPAFAFSYGSINPKVCYAFYTAEGKCSADYADENGTRHCYVDRDMPEGFWDRLLELAERFDMFEWKAPRLFRRFVLNVEEGVLNVEVLFPDGRRINANSMHGDPKNLKEAEAALKALYAKLE